MTSFAVTWDYRCPFARIIHEHVLAALADGADWNVRFVPFSLGQVHRSEGEPAIWDRPDDDSGLLALQVGVAVRDHAPGRFRVVHGALFEARHGHGLDLRNRDNITSLLGEHQVEPGPIWAGVDDGSALATIRREHEAVAASHEVWGVPTFLVDEQAAFVRVMKRPAGDAAFARRTIERVLDLFAEAPELNEFKHTTLPR